MTRAGIRKRPQARRADARIRAPGPRPAACAVRWIASLALVCLAPATAQPQAAAEFDYCLVCHGTEARGNPVVGAPDLAVLAPAYVRRQLEAYRAGWRGTHGEDPFGPEMRAIATALDEEQSIRAAAWVSAFEAVGSRPTVTGDIERGAQLYGNCAGCHGNAGEGNEALASPRLSGQSDWYLLRQMTAYRSGWRGADPKDRPGAQMRALAATLDGEADVRDLVAYINTLDPTP